MENFRVLGRVGFTRSKVELCPNPRMFRLHVNFDLKIHPSLQLLIENIPGVESNNFWGLHKYYISIEVAEMFDLEIVSKQAQEVVENFNLE